MSQSAENLKQKLRNFDSIASINSEYQIFDFKTKEVSPEEKRQIS